ncbi:MAG: MazG nucleotide pyrophosphohydrolase domain-containing protein [Planctomycetota bacterium]
MDLSDLTQRIVAKRAERGFVTDPLKLHILLTEEVGEIAAELKRSWSNNYDGFRPDKLAEEIADTFCLLVALADVHGINVGKAVEDKFFTADDSRTWRTHT